MCTYQGAPFVGEQLESILAQTRPPDEVVVADDASTDATLDVVRRLAEGSDVPVRTIASPRRRGYRRNFEEAVVACSGDVVFLADQDDVWFRDKIEAMLPAFTDDAAIVHCDAVLAGVDLAPKGETVFERHPLLRELEGAIPTARSFGIPGCTMAFRAGLRGSLVPFSDLWGHDLWIALVGGALGSIVPVPRPLMVYRRHGAGAGPSRYLDAGPVGRAIQGSRTRRREDYERDRRKWEEVVQRLEGTGPGLGPDDPRRARLEASLQDYRRRLGLARFRDELRRRPRWRRAAPVLGRVASGDYARYLRPVGSPAKDVLL